MSAASLSSSSSSSAPASGTAASSASSAASRKRPRQQPRHFHAGPQPTAEEEEEKQEELAGQPPSARLHRHALESIFAFLSLKELSSVLAVSRSWQSAVGSMRSIDATVESLPVGRSLVSLCASSLARHLGSLGSSHGLSLSCEALYSLSLRLSGLHTLRYRLSDPLVLPLHFPSSLTRLDVSILSLAPSSDDINSLIVEVSRIVSLQSLALQPNGVSSFAPLIQLPRLREIDLRTYGDVLSEGQIDELRALPHLRVLHLSLTRGEVCALLRTPHQLQLQKLDIAVLDPEVAALLASLPSLTDLSVDGEETVSFLRFTPNLRTHQPHTPAQIIQGLEWCEQLTSLTIEHSKLTAAHLRALLSLMPNLHELHLTDMPQMESLSFLSSSKSLQRSLISLSLSRCCHAQLRSVELRHIFALQQLTRLSIDTSFTEKLDSLTQHDLQAPSQRLPNLVESKIIGID